MSLYPYALYLQWDKLRWVAAFVDVESFLRFQGGRGTRKFYMYARIIQA